MITTLSIALLAVCTTAPELAGRLAYVAGTEQEDRCVMVHDLATGEARRVGSGERDGAPHWSHDGQWLAYETKIPDGMGICVVRADGSENTVITKAYPWNQEPCWHPTKLKLAYTAGEGLARALVVCDIATGEETVWGGETKGIARPVWIHNMRLLAALGAEEYGMSAMVEKFAVEAGLLGAVMALQLSTQSEKWTTSIVVATRSGTLKIPAMIIPEEEAYVEWAVAPSPNGKLVAFESNDGGDREIFVIADTGVQDVSNHRNADWNPVWEGTSRWLAFESFRAGRRGVYRVMPENGRVRPVAVYDHADAWAPAWSPDGSRIAFVSDQEGSPDIYVVSVDGNDVERITKDAGEELAPAWQPHVAE